MFLSLFCRYWIGLNRLEDDVTEVCGCDSNRLTDACTRCRNAFKWADNSTDFVPNFWGSPGDPEENERCVRIRTKYQGQYAWGAAECDETRPYICEAG